MRSTAPSNPPLHDVRRIARRGAAVALVAIGTVTFGCRTDGADRRGAADEPMTLSELLAPRQTAPGGQPVAVVEGALPMAYLLEEDATVSVVDLTTGRTLVTRQAPDGAIVAADAEAGVRIASELAWPGPMPVDHRYAIRVGLPEVPTTAPADDQPQPARQQPGAAPAAPTAPTQQNNGSPGAGAVAPSRPGDPLPAERTESP